MWFYVTLKTYHAHLEKQDQLTALLNNPNARVASGKKGKTVLKKLQAKKLQLAAEAAPKRADDTNSIDLLLAAAKAKVQANKVQAQAEPLLSAYQPPQPQYNYALIEPEQPKLLVPQQQPQYWYPQVSAPLPVPQMVSQPVVAAKPQVDLSSLSKQQLIKALLAQLAKDDIEAQL